MKKLLVTTWMALAIVANVQADKKVYVKSNQLPRDAQIWLDLHMSDHYIRFITAEKHIFGLGDYEVHFQNGYQVDFDRYGTMEGIDCQKDPIPNDLIPQALTDYVRANYKDLFICEYDRDGKEQEIELNNGTKLVFDKEGNFLHIDD